MKMTEKELLQLKEDMEEARQKSAELRGHMTALEKQLKEDWKCNSVAEAEEMLNKIDKEVDELGKKIETGLEKLEEEYSE